IWQNAALSRGYRSVFAVPIRHRDLVHGSLTVYGTEPDTFDSRVREILLELGTLVGNAITAVERRNALHGAGTRDLALDISIAADDPLRLLARRLSNTVEVRSVNRRKGDALLLYCLVPGIDSETVIEVARGIPGISSIDRISNDEISIYEVLTSDACLAAAVTALGASLRSMRVAENSCELTVSVRRDRDRRRFVGQAQELFGNAELKAERRGTPPERMPWATLLAETLTDRQRDVLKAAYHAGYFDENRKRTGGEIADALGIAQPTFSKHLRAAQRNLFTEIWKRPDRG
ncbi:MAG: bacterio-opsin activator domain-containing protein, partial [Natronomonas sp.]